MAFSSIQQQSYYSLLPDSDHMEDTLENNPPNANSVPVRNSRLNKHAFAASLLASTTSILLGYDIGVMSGAIVYIREHIHISTIQVEILVGSLNVCSLIGSLAAGKTSDWIGRRWTIVLAAVTFLIGAVLMGFAPSYGYLMAGRVIAGIGVGYSLMIGPVYTTELSPATSRGFLSSLPELCITIGILLGYLANYFLANLPDNINWRIMLGAAGFPAIAIGLGVMLMPESPRWLVMQGRYDEASKILIKTSNTKEEADLRLEEMKMAVSNSETDENQGQFSGKGVWRELLLRPTRPLKRILIAAIGINFFMQATGNDAVVWKETTFTNRHNWDGLGPITWVYSSEIFPMKYRAQGNSIAVSINRVVSGVVSMTFLTIAHKITFAGVFFILAGIAAVGTIFFYFFLPETKGKTLEEIGALFEDKS
ncbi:Sugar/inositol transporter [Corchorus olitorius]|uniref:Sugar/inositol transporter n=1 Tax=Corchorus olitorius TaxID=93759 RepID=A0A1R3GHX3_9ROSI|nr:Sugar/inositol transporter [Corchorus olitorius]